jgi:hypothetical protein
MRWLVLCLCGNREWSLRLQAPPPTFIKVFEIEQK